MPSVIVVDNLDSFTFTLVDYLLTLGAAVDVVRSSAVSVGALMESGADGFLISPGPGHPRDAGVSVQLARACIDQQRPLLGVCLGHQAIGLACGAMVEPVAPVHGKSEPIRHEGDGLFAGLPSPLTVTRYHSLAVTRLTDMLVPTAWGADGVVQAMRHVQAPVHGVQFHPESVASQHGHDLLAAFLKLCS